MRFERLPSPLPEMRVWAAYHSGYSFVITQELLPDDPEWSGYTASWKNVSADMRPFGDQPSNRIDGGPWKSFVRAEKACEKTLKQLKVKQ